MGTTLSRAKWAKTGLELWWAGWCADDVVCEVERRSAVIGCILRLLRWSYYAELEYS